MTDRFDAYMARVMLTEASRRRGQPDFHAVLLEWAANARKRQQVEPKPPWQRELFA